MEMTQINAPLFHYHSDDWMNDPIPFYWQGEYHVFYQYKTPRQWGHARSTDLLHWETLPVAIAPDSEYDIDGCWTGCCLHVDGQFHLFYTGVTSTRKQTVCHAVSDDLITWRKNSANPIVEASAPYRIDGAWRDPHIWQEDGWWHMLLSAEMPDKPNSAKGCVAHLRSRDLFAGWEVCDPLYISNSMINSECPDVFCLGDQHVLLISGGFTFARYGDSMLGPFRLPRNLPYLDERCYAMKTIEDAEGRRIAWGFIVEPWGWVHENRPPYQDWSGSLCFPRLLAVNAHKELTVSWPEELKQLRVAELPTDVEPSLGNWRTEPGEAHVVDDPEYALAMFRNVPGRCTEISAVITPNGARRAGFVLRCTSNLSDATGLFIDWLTGTVVIEDLSFGFDSVGPRPYAMRSRLYIPDLRELPVHLRIIVDGPLLEACVNGHSIISGHAHVRSPEALQAGIFTVGGKASFSEMQMWNLQLKQQLN